MNSFEQNFSSQQQEGNSKCLQSQQAQQYGFTNQLLMVRPYKFYSNQETMTDNIYQTSNKQKESLDTQTNKEQQFQQLNQEKESLQDKKLINEKALAQFDRFVQKLRKNNVKVTVIQDPGVNECPDSLYANNWISFHIKNNIILYPMKANNRRKQRQLYKNVSFQTQLKTKLKVIQDYSQYQNKDIILEGTGSMVLDRQNKIVYAVLSQRTSKQLIERFCSDMGYSSCCFHASQYSTIQQTNVPIYHTNMLMSVSKKFIMIGMQLIDNEQQRKLVSQTIRQRSKKQLIELTSDQIANFAGNTLSVSIPKQSKTAQNSTNQQKEELIALIMSEKAYRILREDQLKIIEKHVQKIIHVDLQTIERNGGGSARCMLMQIF